jgi:hypothetical protein
LKHNYSNPTLGLLAVATVSLALAACGRTSDTSLSPSAPSAAAAAADLAQSEADRAADIAAREQELAEREAAVKQQELAQAELAATAAAEKAAAADKAAAEQKARTAAAQKKAAATSTTVKATPKPPAPIIVPAGTQLAVELTTPIGTKTAKVGDSVQGRLQSDLMVGDRRAASAGAAVEGSVTQVVSGSNKIGGVPTLAITFNTLRVVNGLTVPISGQLVQQGTSETAKDTAKIVGGAALGAIIGHQVDDKNGTVIGGVLGGAAGTAAAKKTGGEVNLPAGTVVAVTTQSSFQVDR